MDQQALQILQRMSDKQEKMLVAITELNTNYKHVTVDINNLTKEVEEMDKELHLIKADVKEAPSKLAKSVWAWVIGIAGFASVVINIIIRTSNLTGN